MTATSAEATPAKGTHKRLNRSPLWPAGDAILREEWRKGTTFTVVAEMLTDAFGIPVSRTTVRGRAKRLGLARHMGWQYAQKAVPAARTEPPVKREGAIHVPQWVHRVFRWLCAHAVDGSFDGVIRMGNADLAMIGRAVKHMADLKIITAERSRSGRRIALLVHEDCVAVGTDDAEVRKARQFERFEEAWRMAFPNGADYGSCSPEDKRFLKSVRAQLCAESRRRPRFIR